MRMSLKHRHGLMWEHKVEKGMIFGEGMAKVNKVLML